MKNNKGFTLVELMAVIVVLAIIISIAVPSAISISHRIKSRMYDTKIEMIESSAKIYGQDNPSSVSSDESCQKGVGIISVQTLVDNGYIKKDDIKEGKVLNPIDNSSLNESTICVYKKNNRVYAKFNKKGNDNSNKDITKDVTAKEDLESAIIKVISFSGKKATLEFGVTDSEAEISKYVVKYGTSVSELTNKKKYHQHQQPIQLQFQ